jgi:hypothetical protein
LEFDFAVLKGMKMIGLKSSVLSMAILVSAFAGQSLSVLAGCPGAVYYKYTKAQTLSTPIGWTIFQDMDNDGRKDLIGINKSTTTAPAAAGFVFYKRTAGGYVTAPVISSSGASFTTFALTIGDINGDGNLDLLNTDTNAAPYTVTAYYGNGSGGFTPGVTSTVGYSGTFSIGDLNGDGKGDLVSSSSSGVGYHLVQPDGSFGPYVNISAAQFKIVRLADFNVDGKLDVLIWGYPDGAIMINQGSGNFTAGATTNVFNNQEPNFIADVNGDGRPDIVTNAHIGIQDSSVYGFSVYLTQPGAASFAVTSYIPGYLSRPNNFDVHTEVADVDGDGDLDVLFATSKLYFIIRNNGSGVMAPEVAVNTSLQPGFYDDAVGDAAADAISLNRPGIFNALSDSVKFSQSVCAKPGRTDFIDFDGDGNTDIGFFRPQDGYWSHRNSHDTFYPFTNISGFGTVGDIPASQDFNGDGITDRAFFRPSTGTWSIRDAATAVISNVQWGANGDRPVPSDYDGDGKADIGIYRPSNGTWWILYSSNGGYSVQSFGISEDIPVPMDYDGDRLADIAVFRPSTGVWYIQKSTGGYFISPFGISTDKPIPGDFDNDGSADIAVFRNGQWYMARTRDSALAYGLFGQAGDVPIPFNHVSRNWGANFAVYRSGWLFDMGEMSQGVPEMPGNVTTSTILPAN